MGGEETREVLAGRVAKGAVWLDEHRGPDWADKVDLDELCMADPCNCVLGQLERQRNGGNYIDVVEKELDECPIRARLLGFTLLGNQRFEDLEQVWAALIRGRRLEGKREVTA